MSRGKKECRKHKRHMSLAKVVVPKQVSCTEIFACKNAALATTPRTIGALLVENGPQPVIVLGCHMSEVFIDSIQHPLYDGIM